MSEPRSWWPEGLLVPILVLASVMRLASLPARGLIYWDEGKFALEGIRLEAILRSVVGLSAASYAGKAVGTAKPGHALLLALSYAVFGIHDYSALLLNATASVLSVALTFVIARRLFDTPSALLASLLLAVSEYDVLYARSALSESDANLLLLIAMSLWLPSVLAAPAIDPTARPRLIPRLLLTGTVLGAGFTVNYRLSVFIAVIVGADLLWRLRGQGAYRAAVAAISWALGLVVFPLLWELAGLALQAHGTVLFRGELAPGGTYFQQVAYQLHGGKQASLHAEPLLYLQWWVLRQGILASVLLGIALLYAVWRRTMSWVLPAAMILLPYTIYIFAPFIVPRNLSPAVPFGAILTGALLVRFTGLAHRTRMLMVAALVMLVAGLGAEMSWRLTAERSGFALAAQYVDNRLGGRTLTTSEIMVFYLRGTGRFCFAPPVPRRPEVLGAYRAAGYAYAVVDSHHSTYVVNLIVRRAQRVVRFPALGNLDIGESPISSENGDPPHTAGSAAESVAIYRLSGLSLPVRGRVSPCSRDQIS